MIYATSVLRPDDAPGELFGRVTLAHDERHLRRKLLHLEDGRMVMLDLKEAVMLAGGDVLALDNGGHVLIDAKPEALMEVRARDGLHLIELAWHLGNRHLAAQVEKDRILILRDHVIRDMLERLGASVCDVEEPFQPVRGAYHSQAHGHGHHHHD
ncbi:urease accessory protein UreE [Rhizobium sp. L1K21]|uniref:urease accessory protein UreE n=1 Tax=Rhizobium sp. L1K21 TaxID=2954933 RepID=UPI00209313DE|nr:urease accessory protein UreE [Rhizobium sp. L1K21]MCO6185325.1 urease accessory protein UreE [Rhizobium sp. L1K21]